MFFDTSKKLRVRNGPAALARYLLLTLIAVYLLVYTVVVKKLYLEPQLPCGVPNLVLKGPVNPPSLKLCKYCSQSAVAFRYKQECTRQAADEVSVLGDSSLFVATSFETLEQTLVCAPTSDSCLQPWNSTNTSNYYLAGMESYQLVLDHNIKTDVISQSQYTLDANDHFLGSLFDVNGKELQKLTGGSNTFNMSTLLKAAHVELNNFDAASNSTLRRSGLNLLLTVDFQYSVTDEYAYSLSVRVLPNQQTRRFVGSELSPTGTTRTKTIKTGVTIFVVFTGEVGAFSVPFLLVQLATGLVLMAVANFLVETGVLMCSGHKQKLILQKYEVFEPLTQGVGDFGRLDSQTEQGKNDLADLRNLNLGLDASSAGLRSDITSSSEDDNNPPSPTDKPYSLFTVSPGRYTPRDRGLLSLGHPGSVQKSRSHSSDRTQSLLTKSGSPSISKG